MGRLPSHFAGQEIRSRVPYDLAGNLNMGESLSGQTYPDATFLNAIAMPFEVHRMIPRLVGIDEDGNVELVQPDIYVLESLIQMRIECLTANQPFSKAASFINTFTKGTSEKTWEWAEPYYLPNGHQFRVQLDSITFPAGAEFTTIRVSIKFQGFLLQIAPASEAR